MDTLPGSSDGDDWQDPDYLESLVARAIRLTLTDGAHVSLSLTVR